MFRGARSKRMSIIRHLRESTLQFTLFAASLIGLQLGSAYIQTALTAFIQSEGIWSKAQKNASRDLSLYVVTEKPELLEEFFRHLTIILADKAARLELEKPDPDFAIADQMLVAGGNDPSDVRKMAYVTHYGRSLPYASEALALWREGDDEIALLESTAREIHQKLKSGSFSPEVRDRYVMRIAEVNERLTLAEISFSDQLRKLASLLENIVFSLYGILALISGAYSVHIFRRSENFVDSIGRLVQAIESTSESDQCAKVKIEDWRELSVIADAFNEFVILRNQHEATRTELATLEKVIRTLNNTAIISMTDERGRIVFTNEKFCEVSGYTREELIGQTHRMINSSFHSREFFKDLWSTIRAGNTWNGEICNRRKDGAIYWVDSTIKPVQGPGGRMQYLSIRYDITARKQMQENFIQNAKLTSLGEMAASVAHEINNPMVVINGYAQQLRSMVASSIIDPVSVTKKLDAILNAGHRVATIVKELLNFSRDGTNDPPAPESIRPLIEVAADLCRSQMDRNEIELFMGPMDHVCVVRGVQISQVIFNLLSNACDALENFQGQRWIKIESEAAAGRVRIKVTDSGAKIPPEIAQKMMQPFFTTKPVGKGTGLGLSVSRGIAEAHHGSLILDESAEHTCFILELPLYGGSQRLGGARKAAG